MANPFLVLGGVAVGVITAAIGVLSVPGWIDNANDSAAINDLGNIRGAESAAILQLGSYTDDFAVLRSGELGVKFQKSDGVALIGLEADTNESWCAAVMSKTGRFFAASNVQAAIATGPGAESAMTTAGCAPAVIEEIIEKALDGTGPEGRPVEVGTPGGTGGSWVGGGNSGSEGSGPGNGGSGIEPGSVPGAAALGPVASLYPVVEVAWTNHGVYGFNAMNGQLLKTGSDGKGHSIALTGPVTSARLAYDRGLDASRNGFVYAAGDDLDTGDDRVFRIAPDNTSVDLTPAGYSVDGLDYNYYIEKIAVAPDGTVYFTGGRWEPGGVNRTWVMRQSGNNTYEPLAALYYGGELLSVRSMDADANGNVFFTDNQSRVFKVDSSGTVSLFADLNNIGYFGKIVVSNSGEVFVGGAQRILRVSEGGATQQIAYSDMSSWSGLPDNAWGIIEELSMDGDGNFYSAEPGFSSIVKITPDGTVSNEAKD